MSKPLKVFITYSHQDTDAKDKLIECLAVMKQQDMITTWHDNEILPGDKWSEAISNNLANSDILLYLVSASSLASENCNKELGDVLDFNIEVIPIILEDCDWKNHRLSKYEVLPNKSKPINEWKPESKAWQNVVDGIRKIVNKVQSQMSNSVQKGTLFERAFRQGNFLMTIGQIGRAIEAYSRAIDLDPKNAVAYGNRGVAYDIKGHTDQAIEDLNKARELKPDDAVVYYNHGIVCQGKGDLDLAIKDYTKAIELGLNYAMAYYNRGKAYHTKVDLDHAIHTKVDLDHAIRDYSQAIKLKKNYVEAYINRGVAYRRKGKIDLAIKDYTKAIDLNPGNDKAYKNRGMAYYLKGAYDCAIKDYSRIIKLNPDANDYFSLGMCWIHLQNWQEAKTNLIIAKRMGMDIIAAFCGYYKNVETFEKRSGIQLPGDIAAMLTQQ